MTLKRFAFALLLAPVLLFHYATVCIAQTNVSGIYPHLAMFNAEGECGTGAVVPWAGKLWVVTYAPHKPSGSSDKLYEISAALEQTVRPESIGGTPANRMIHRPSNQLFIGPYAIDQAGSVRVIPYKTMFGRPTGNARHLVSPDDKIFYATMEEGFYEVDVKTLEVKELWADEQVKDGRHANLPGYHGKGLYSSQGVLVYANNGEHGSEALKRPDVPSGVLAEWDGKSDAWKVVRRNQFTEVTGPGGIEGSQPNDPIWSIGWDHRSLILMCRDKGSWSAYRLPKASHSYDGAHGWNTEWPRIRDVGENDLLMTMHGMFWRFPRSFSKANSSGIAPRSTYLKVIGDFCRWNDRLVFGCDDTAQNEFLNKRKAKGQIAAPQSQSNLWFMQPEQLDQLGPTHGRGAVWLADDVAASTPSEPMLFSGFEFRAVHLAHQTDSEVMIRFEVDQLGNGKWTTAKEIKLKARESTWLDLVDQPNAAWIRVVSDQPLKQATAWFTFANRDRRKAVADPMFDGLTKYQASSTMPGTGGIVRARAQDKRTLHFVAERIDTQTDAQAVIGLYELDGSLNLKRVDDNSALQYQTTQAAIPTGVLKWDDASVIFEDEHNQRWRIPSGMPLEDLPQALAKAQRVCREVATERDLFNAAGIFYELPAENAGGFAKVRAVTTHGRRIIDFCSFRGLLIMSGLDNKLPSENRHIVTADDKQTSLWVGAIDDVWRMGRARGLGGPWKNSQVKAGQPSDPYLMNGFENKELRLSHQSAQEVAFQVECDITGTGHWLPYERFTVKPGETLIHHFPLAYSAYWLRVTAAEDCTATATLRYE